MPVKRIFLIVLDSFGIGNAPDAEAFGDKGADTLRSVSRSEFFNIPNLTALGLPLIEGADCAVFEKSEKNNSDVYVQPASVYRNVCGGLCSGACCGRPAGLMKIAAFVFPPMLFQWCWVRFGNYAAVPSPCMCRAAICVFWARHRKRGRHFGKRMGGNQRSRNFRRRSI